MVKLFKLGGVICPRLAPLVRFHDLKERWTKKKGGLASNLVVGLTLGGAICC
jgi:hypothetical protein